jgi:hypothetical protein
MLPGIAGKLLCARLQQVLNINPNAQPRNAITEIEMERYKNLSGWSGVVAYEIGEDYIRIQFKNNKILKYTYGSAGQDQVEQMKLIAQNGRKLNSFIRIYVVGMGVKE